MDKLHAMATFIQIVDRGSLTRAAASMGTSLPSVVRTLAALEESLGVRLLNRTTRRISLTQEGRHYLARCRSILVETEEAESALSSQRQEPRGELRVTAVPGKSLARGRWMSSCTKRRHNNHQTPSARYAGQRPRRSINRTMSCAISTGRSSTEK